MMTTDNIFDSLISISAPAVREAIDHHKLEHEAHRAPITDGQAVFWLLDYGAKVYLATVPKECAADTDAQKGE